MFLITPRHFSHIHSRNPCPVPLGSAHRSIDQTVLLPRAILPSVVEEVLGREWAAREADQDRREDRQPQTLTL
jgi:hypothetical protein